MDRILAPRPFGAIAMRIAKIVAFPLLASLVLNSGCSLTAPSGDDDAVQRCATTSDCLVLESKDNRFTYACVRAPGQSEQSEQVCEPRKANVTCGFAAAGSSVDADSAPTSGDDYLAYLLRVASDLSGDPSTKLCPDDKLGTFGCPPDKDNECSEGEVTKIGSVEFCSDPKSPTIPAGGSTTLAEADVRDQYCRWYFCDDKMVCNAGQCVPCDPSKSFENGGCRAMYRNGEPSPVQVDVADNCNSGTQGSKDIKAESKVFGDFPPKS